MKQSICGGWEFSEQWSDEFAVWKAEAACVELPHNVKEMPLHYGDSGDYQMICGYRRKLTIPERSEEKRYFLQFDGAAHIATVYVNGSEAGHHRCGYTAFTVEITRLIHPGENTVAVRLDTTENPSIPPFGFVVDYLTYGGLYREAWLIEKPQQYIRDVFVWTPTTDSVKITVDAPDYDGEYLAEILDEGGKTIWQMRSAKPELEASGLAVCPWSLREPVRYTCAVSLMGESGASDREEVRFGFRTAQFLADGFYLNGEKTFLRGLNRHQCYPYIGYAAPESLQREDARILKEELGCTAVRTSHYPQSQHFIDECDRIGLLVFTEIPGWQHLGDEDWKQQACRNVEEMVLQYRNHPSIVLWGVRINESVDDDALYRQTNRIAHELDPSRQTSGVRYLEKSSLLEDVYAFNDFSHNGSTPGCKPKKQVSTHPEKPLLISECNGHMFPTKPFDTWERRQEHAMRHARVHSAACADGEHAGCFGWCMFDYATHKDFGSGDRICYHGVMDSFRNPKTAAAVYASQSDNHPVLEVASSMDIGDYPAGNIGTVAVFSNADRVELYKNDVFVTTLSRSGESALPHPPFLMDDTIGQLLETQEGFPKAKADDLRQCLKAVVKYGLPGLPLRWKLKLGWCMVRYQLSFADGVALFGKYTSDWGGAATQWRFDAIKDGKVIKSVVKGASAKLRLEAIPSAERLCMGDTYDMAAVRIRIVDEFGNIAPYAQLPVTLNTEGSITLVGPSVVTAEGGMCGTYLRTDGRRGEAKLTISCPQTQPVLLQFTIE